MRCVSHAVTCSEMTAAAEGESLPAPRRMSTPCDVREHGVDMFVFPSIRPQRKTRFGSSSLGVVLGLFHWVMAPTVWLRLVQVGVFRTIAHGCLNDRVGKLATTRKDALLETKDGQKMSHGFHTEQMCFW